MTKLGSPIIANSIEQHGTVNEGRNKLLLAWKQSLSRASKSERKHLLDLEHSLINGYTIDELADEHLGCWSFYTYLNRKIATDAFYGAARTDQESTAKFSWKNELLLYGGLSSDSAKAHCSRAISSALELSKTDIAEGLVSGPPDFYRVCTSGEWLTLAHDRNEDGDQEYLFRFQQANTSDEAACRELLRKLINSDPSVIH